MSEAPRTSDDPLSAKAAAERALIVYVTLLREQAIWSLTELAGYAALFGFAWWVLS